MIGGVEDVMAMAEEKQLDYLFRLRKSKYVKQLIHKHHSLGGWDYVIDGWEATDDRLKLASWSNERRVLIVRRRLPKDAVPALETKWNVGAGY